MHCGDSGSWHSSFQQTSAVAAGDGDVFGVGLADDEDVLFGVGDGIGDGDAFGAGDGFGVGVGVGVGVGFSAFAFAYASAAATTDSRRALSEASRLAIVIESAFSPMVTNKPINKTKTCARRLY